MNTPAEQHTADERWAAKQVEDRQLELAAMMAQRKSSESDTTNIDSSANIAREERLRSSTQYGSPPSIATRTSSLLNAGATAPKPGGFSFGTAPASQPATFGAAAPTTGGASPLQRFH